MSGFNVSAGNRFVESGGVRELKSQTFGEQKGDATQVVGGASFADTLSASVKKVNQMQLDADKAAQNLATGRTDNIAEVMIATEKADIAVRLMMQVRNKIIDAYQDIMRMQV